MKRPFALSVASVLALLTCSSVHAAPVLWSSGVGGNNHWYELIIVPNPYTGNNNSWFTAQAAAHASTFGGQPGYLATVTSAGENAFLATLIPGGLGQGDGAWLGGKSPEGWLDGPENGQVFGYTNWGGVEPNNAGYGYMIIGSTFVTINTGQWADDDPGNGQGIPNSVGDRVIGYFVEYNAIPEPATLLVAGGFVGLGFLARRRARRAAA